ncbi:MAG: non-homologous end-joining DNA ligase [Acidimicrobiia bacterium]
MEVSNPDKVLYPDDGITKAEIVAYYASVAEAMLPHLKGRPLTLERYPDGIGTKGFMQKNASKHFPKSIERVEVPKEGGTTNHPLCDSVDDLVYLANQGTITFHIWTARQPHLDRPDRLVLDLDPAEDAESPRAAAQAARAVLEDVGLESGLMTTGSRGYHVIARIEPDHDYDVVGEASRLLAGVVAVRHPDEMTTEFRKAARAGRVFVDWLRNRWAQSVVSAWSLRPRPSAPVAMPITWEELATAEPGRWTVKDAAERISQDDPWPSPGKLDPQRVVEVAEEHGVSFSEPFDRFRDTR